MLYRLKIPAPQQECPSHPAQATPYPASSCAIIMESPFLLIVHSLFSSMTLGCRESSGSAACGSHLHQPAMLHQASMIMGVTLCLHLSIAILPGPMHLLVASQNERVDLHPLFPACPSQPYMPLPSVAENSPPSKTATIIIRSAVPACRSP